MLNNHVGRPWISRSASPGPRREGMCLQLVGPLGPLGGADLVHGEGLSEQFRCRKPWGTGGIDKNIYIYLYTVYIYNQQITS